MTKQTTVLILSAMFGMALGYAFGGGARKATPSAVSAQLEGTEAVVTIDLASLVRGGINGIIGR